MFAVEVEVPQGLKFTDNAAAKVKALIAAETKEYVALRVFVQGGGCSGFQYGFDFDDTINEDDTVVENQGVKLVVDAMSYQYLNGAKVDFVDNLEGAQFVIDNPNAKSSCGCGSSFSM